MFTARSSSSFRHHHYKFFADKARSAVFHTLAWWCLCSLEKSFPSRFFPLNRTWDCRQSDFIVTAPSRELFMASPSLVLFSLHPASMKIEKTKNPSYDIGVSQSRRQPLLIRFHTPDSFSLRIAFRVSPRELGDGYEIHVEPKRVRRSSKCVCFCCFGMRKYNTEPSKTQNSLDIFSFCFVISRPEFKAFGSVHP